MIILNILTRKIPKSIIKPKISLFANILIVNIFIGFALSACTKNDIQKKCTTLAVVKDLRGSDGCGFVFELEDGERLEPVQTDIELFRNIELREGKKVAIAYQNIENAYSNCMMGKMVKITCIESITEPKLSLNQ